MKDTFYVTTAIPYVNAKPHIGHALEMTQADVIARLQATTGKKTLLLSGGDENALKNVQAAEKARKPVQQFVDEHTAVFHNLAQSLHCRFDIWQKGSSDQHHKSSQKLWKQVLAHNPDDIYQKEYKGLYCIGCETFYTSEELNANGECHEHPGKKLELVTEKNYFFRLSAYQDKLLHLIESDELNIIPHKRKKEVTSFISQGLEDISISRSNNRAKNWGVPVPGDDSQRMYVWFDALNIYQSGIGFGWNEERYAACWPADVHVIGKGILRFHAVFWPAFLLSAQLKIPKNILVHEYFTVNGQKMSKTLGNVIDPFMLIDTYGAEALRYYFLAKFSPFTDGDFSEEKLINAYNSDLANGIGNLVSRVAKLIQKNKLNLTTLPHKDRSSNQLLNDVSTMLKSDYEFDKALTRIWEAIRALDKFIEQEKPWNKTEQEAHAILETIICGSDTLVSLRDIGESLLPFLPETARKIRTYLDSDGQDPIKPLFPRIQTA